MKRNSETPQPKMKVQLETFGGAYHRLESTFRPAKKVPPVQARRKPAPKADR